MPRERRSDDLPARLAGTISLDTHAWQSFEQRGLGVALDVEEEDAEDEEVVDADDEVDVVDSSVVESDGDSVVLSSGSSLVQSLLRPPR